MTGLGVSIAIIKEGKIVLIQREDFEVWGLPGGEIDAGETAAQTAIREAKEETGLDVRLTRMVGLYAIPAWQSKGIDNHNVIFAAEPISGSLQPQAHETLDVRYFSLDELPDTLMWWHRQRIHDAMNGVGGSVFWRQDVKWPFTPEMTRRDIYAQRDQSGLSRAEFFNQMVNPPGDETREVGD